jgi:hypothetical protein
LFILKLHDFYYKKVPLAKGMDYGFDCHLVEKFLVTDTAMYIVKGAQRLEIKIFPLGKGFVL